MEKVKKFLNKSHLAFGSFLAHNSQGRVQGGGGGEEVMPPPSQDKLKNKTMDFTDKIMT